MARLTYILYRVATWLICLLPLTACFRLGQSAGAFAFLMGGTYRNLVLRNLRIAYGEQKSPGELRDLARRHLMTLGANLFSSVKVATMPATEIDRHAKIEHLDRMKAAFDAGHGVVMVISHIGNWELFAQLAHHLPERKLSTIYQPLGNRLIDEHVRSMRSRAGVVPLSRKEGFTTALKLLRENGLVGVLVDQHAGDGGIWCPLFNRLASTSPLAATIALRTGAALVPVAIYTDGLASWRVVVSEPISRAEGATIEVMTAEINQALERQIRESPEDWFWVHDRWKTPKPNFLLTGYKRGIAYPDKFDRAALKPFNILIRSSNWLGDAVMTIPAVRAIKRGRPDARVSVLTKQKLADFWKAVSEVDEVVSIEPGEGLWQVAAKIRERYDVAVLFPNSVRSALEVFAAGLPRRVGVRGKWRRRLLNQIFEPEKPEKPAPQPHQAFQYLALAAFLGAEVPTVPGFESASRETAGGKLRLGLCPGAEYGPAKRWLPERFGEVAKTVAEQIRCEWLLFGTGADVAAGEIVAASIEGRVTNLIGKTTLAELIEQLSQCRLLLTNDTGTMHLAAFLGVPTVSIFGSTEPSLTGPIGAGHQVVRHHVECSPCFLRECPIDFRCMRELDTARVTAAVLKALSLEGCASSQPIA